LFSDGGSGRATALAALVGGSAVSNTELGERAELVVLAHKPMQLEAVAAEVGSPPIVLSLLGAVTLAALAAAYGDAPYRDYLARLALESSST